MKNQKFKSFVVKPANKFSKLRIFILCFIGAIIGWTCNWTFDCLNAPQVFIRKSAYAIDYHGYLGIVIDRKLNNTCDLQPDRILFKLDSVDGQTLPVIIPIGSQSIVWPVLGDQKILILVSKLNDFPPGNWETETFYRENCHWWNLFLGAKVEVTAPFPVDINPQ